jgi:pimeloyl-ACP methyl ester carboxylesterase
MDASRVGRLVLAGAAGIKPRDGQGEIMDMMLMDFVEYMEAGFRDQDAFHEMFGIEVEKDVKQLWDYSREMTARVSWKPYLFSRQLPHLLKTVQAPALLIWGSEDRVVPIDSAHQYRDALPNARLEVIEGAGHYVEYEEPETVARLIAAHIRGH